MNSNRVFSTIELIWGKMTREGTKIFQWKLCKNVFFFFLVCYKLFNACDFMKFHASKCTKRKAKEINFTQQNPLTKWRYQNSKWLPLNATRLILCGRESFKMPEISNFIRRCVIFVRNFVTQSDVFALKMHYGSSFVPVWANIKHIFAGIKEFKTL